MSDAGTDPRPLAACVCTNSLLVEALDSVLAGLAAVRRVPSGAADLPGLLRALQPDAVVVDSEDDTAAAQPFADESGVLLVQVALPENSIRLRRRGRWEQPQAVASPAALRNLLLAGLDGARGRR